MGQIQITIVKTARAGQNEVAKTYNTTFEGEMSDYKKLQEGIDQVVDKLIWEIKGNKMAGGLKSLSEIDRQVIVDPAANIPETGNKQA